MSLWLSDISFSATRRKMISVFISKSTTRIAKRNVNYGSQRMNPNDPVHPNDPMVLDEL